jgi:hypothetical protein
MDKPMPTQQLYGMLAVVFDSDAVRKYKMRLHRARIFGLVLR